MRENPEQQQASQYLLGLRRAEIEPLISHDDFAALSSTLDQPFIDGPDRAHYLESWRQPGALQGMLRWYQREGLGPPGDGAPSRGNYVPEVTPLLVSTPTLVIYPTADLYTRPPAHEGLDQYVPELLFQEIDGGTHWVAEEHPDLVNRHIRDFPTSR